MTKLPKSLEQEIKSRAIEYASFEDGLNTEVDASKQIDYETGANFGASRVKAAADKLAEALKSIANQEGQYWKEDGIAMTQATEKIDDALADWNAMWGQE